MADLAQHFFRGGADEPHSRADRKTEQGQYLTDKCLQTLL
ncbi:hypothetical protein EMIT013CA1_80004 [Bacillus sp. IT-13CA1]